MKYPDLRRWILEDAKNDIVGLWYVSSWAKQCVPGGNSDQARAAALSVIEELLSEEAIVVGIPSKDGNHFFPWPGSPQEIVQKLEHEWIKLGRDPDVAEIAWLARPELATGSA